MKNVNSEIKKVVDKVKVAQEKLQGLLNNQNWIEEARKYAERQGKEVKKLLSADVTKVKTFLEKEKKELDRFQKEIPGEVKKLKDLVKAQRKELEKLLGRVGKASAAPKRSKKATGSRKKTSSKKSTESTSSSNA